MKRQQLLDLATMADRLELLPRDRVLPGFHAKARAWVKGRTPAR
jgi:hypothetical protein